jgi:hypothetical protein
MPLTLQRTYPTVYVAYISPTLVLQTSLPQLPHSSCLLSTIPIELPSTATPQLVFAPTDDDPFPGTDSAFSYVDSLPTLTSLLSGGNPSSCYQGIPSAGFKFPNTPFIVPLSPISYTTVSVLTSVGDPVTFTAPFPNGPGNQPTGGGSGQSILPQSEQLGSGTSAGSPPVTQIVAGQNTIQEQPSAVVINGQTFTQGVHTTLSNGVVVSVGASSTVVVVGGSTVPLATGSHTSTSSSGQNPGTSIASGIGISGEAGQTTSWMLALEAIIVFGLPGVLAIL